VRVLQQFRLFLDLGFHVDFVTDGNKFAIKFVATLAFEIRAFVVLSRIAHDWSSGKGCG
jgi:hypothetical protein